MMFGHVRIYATVLLGVALAATAPTPSAAAPLDEVQFVGWGRDELAIVNRAPYYLTREVLLGLPVDPPAANGAATTRAELDELLRLQAARTSAQVLAIAQHREYASICSAFLAVLHRAPTSAAATRALLEHVNNDAMIAVFAKKRRFDRARPTQLEPRLRPSLPVPAHAAYPSGHALQGYLVARVLSDLSPDDRDVLEALGTEIGHEREVAGLHFPSDSGASRKLGEALYTRLLDNPRFVRELDAARVEWPPVRP